MQEIFLGEVIRQRRLELGLTQEALCEGICEPMTISRFENGKQTPSRNRIKALLQRLGMPDDRFFGMLSEKEAQQAALRRQILAYGSQFDQATPEDRPELRRKCLEKCRELEKILDKDDGLSRQFLMHCQFAMGTEEGYYSFEEGTDLVLRALRITSPNFSVDHIGQGLYTLEEVKLINNLAQCYIRSGQHLEAANILRQLFLYVKTRWEKIPGDQSMLPIISFNYSLELKKLKQYRESEKIAEFGRKLSIEYGYYEALPDLLWMLALCTYHQNRLDESREWFIEAYYLLKITEYGKGVLQIRKEAKELLNLELN